MTRLGFHFGWMILLGFSLANCSSCVNRSKAPEAAKAEPPSEPTVREFPQKDLTGSAEQRKVRRAAVAGSWYYGDKARLAPYLDELLSAADEAASGSPPGAKAGAEEVIALVSPHAGFNFSGKGAAAGYRLLKGRDIKRVVVLAVSHRVPFRGASIAEVTHYETPLGLIPLDQPAVKAIRELDLVGAVPEAHREEHSLEMQLPLLQRVLPGGFTLVPILLSRMEAGDYKKLARVLGKVVDQQTVVIASSDFTHRGPNYSYEVPPGEKPVKARLRDLDDGSVARMLKLDRQGLLDHAHTTGSTICGLHPVALLLELLSGQEGIKGRTVSHYTSGDVTGEWRNTVTYITVAYTGRWPMTAASSGAGGLSRARNAGSAAFPLSAKEKATLLKLARETLEASVRKGTFDSRPLDLLYLDDSLRRKAGAFVTLKCKMGAGAVCVAKGDALRGCIGTIGARTGVALTVAQRAASAALDDHRFPRKVTSAELPKITVEVSVLTPPRAISSAADFKVGVHGIILSKGGRSATYLPQVAPEQGWDRDDTLSHLSRKAGLGPDGWRDGAKFQVYEAIVFSEGH